MRVGSSISEGAAETPRCALRYLYTAEYRQMPRQESSGCTKLPFERLQSVNWKRPHFPAVSLVQNIVCHG
jgi:hypothetical protein